MNLILWRHAEAEDGVPDLERGLTDKGRRQADAAARWLRPYLNSRVEADGLGYLKIIAFR